MSYDNNVAKTQLCESRRHRTKWLDGLRGIAALIVAIDHYLMDDAGVLFKCVESGPTQILQYLPFLRIMFTAHSMVAVFFVISGYCISCSALSLRDDGQVEKLFHTISSFILRRVARLFIPVMAISLLSQLAIYLNMYPSGIIDNGLKPFGNPWPHLCSLLRDLSEMLDIMAWLAPTHRSINNQLWTIPVELRGSYIVCICILGLARVQSNIRLSLLFLIGSHFLWYGRWDGACFVGGLFTAEWNSHFRKHIDEYIGLSPTIDSKRKRNRAFQLLNIIIFILGVYLVCLTDDDCFETHHQILLALSPSPWGNFAGKIAGWKAIGAILFVFSISNSSFLRKPLEKRVIQDLGNISFSLYLVHIMLLKMWKYRLNALFSSLLTNYSGAFWMSRLATMVIMGPLTIWVSHVFCKFIDVPSLTWTRWLEKRLIN